MITKTVVQVMVKITCSTFPSKEIITPSNNVDTLGNAADNTAFADNVVLGTAKNTHAIDIRAKTIHRFHNRALKLF